MLSAQEALERELIDEITDNLPEALERKLHQWNAKPLQAMIKTKKYTLN